MSDIEITPPTVLDEQVNLRGRQLHGRWTGTLFHVLAPRPANVLEQSSQPLG
jgi:hypothetical protein